MKIWRHSPLPINLGLGVGCWVALLPATRQIDDSCATTNLGPRGASTQVIVCLWIYSEMAVALASSPAASVRALQRCVVGNGSGCSRFMLLRASPSQSQLQSQPLKCGGACNSRKLGGWIVGSRLQRFSIVASAMGSPTPSQVGFGLLPWSLGSGTIQFREAILFGEAFYSGSCIGNVNWIGAFAWITSNRGYVVGCCGFAAEPDELVGMVWFECGYQLETIECNSFVAIVFGDAQIGCYWLEWFLDDSLCWNLLKQGYVVRGLCSQWTWRIGHGGQCMNGISVAIGEVGSTSSQ